MFEVFYRHLLRALIVRLTIYSVIALAVVYCVWLGYEGITGWNSGMEKIHSRQARIDAVARGFLTPELSRAAKRRRLE